MCSVSNFYRSPNSGLTQYHQYLNAHIRAFGTNSLLSLFLFAKIGRMPLTASWLPPIRCCEENRLQGEKGPKGA